MPRPRTRKAATAEREAHTVYLREQVWNRLDREYAKLRSAARGGLSKIEFVEQVLEAGMTSLASGVLVAMEEPGEPYVAPDPGSKQTRPPEAQR